MGLSWHDVLITAQISLGQGQQECTPQIIWCMDILCQWYDILCQCGRRVQQECILQTIRRIDILRQCDPSMSVQLWRLPVVEKMRRDMRNISLTPREAVHDQRHPQQGDLLEVMYSHSGDNTPSNECDLRTLLHRQHHASLVACMPQVPLFLNNVWYRESCGCSSSGSRRRAIPLNLPWGRFLTTEDPPLWAPGTERICSLRPGTGPPLTAPGWARLASSSHSTSIQLIL
ncbi:uncharacterized protein LOC112258349 isoform X2 [Oncorhynchus tshawytscha]|uniref:uncharacterized protein LOC112258349 isoform X2 n=1 Tax=Oncorhynchus tshawytscha TaxID=74940 RepID=UPI001C3C5574|nr:uncharacterized protein LOC112258349 isoform X2 [Oncorhynchus tshawytscha]